MPFTILLVEEDRGAGEPLAEFLRARGCRVWTANRARDALAMIQRGWVTPSLMLIGLPGPRADFEQFLVTCSAEPQLANVPIVLMSNDATVSTESLPGVRAVVSKPIALDHLLDVDAQIARSHGLDPMHRPTTRFTSARDDEGQSKAG